MPNKDPIIEEIHAAPEGIARRAGYNLKQILEMARARQAASGLPSVRLNPRKPEPIR